MKNIEQANTDPAYLKSQGLSPTFPRRFFDKVFVTPTHWLWEGPRKERGHGSIWRGVRNPVTNRWNWLIGTHVASWILFNGPVPQGQWILHCCPGPHIPWCVNPDHLMLGDDEENKRHLRNQIAMGLHRNIKRGTVCRPKLTPEQIDEIRRLYTGEHGQQVELGKQFGVTSACIGHVIRAQTWKDNASDAAHASYTRYQSELKAERERPKLVFPYIGETNPNAKITREIAETIRKEYTGANGQQTALAKKYGIQQAAVWKILNHKIWK